MKKGDMIFFVILMLTVYCGLNALIGMKMRQALAGTGILRAVVLILFLAWAATFPAGMIMDSRSSGMPARILVQCGSLFLAVMVYAFLAVLLLECAWGLHRLFHWIPGSWLSAPAKTLRIVFACAAAAVVLTVMAGTVNARHPRVKRIDIDLPSPGASLKSFKIVLLSDLHLGIVQNPPWLEKIVAAVNRLSPDAILICGDVIDRDAFHHDTEKHKALLRSLKSGNGVFAVTGNHEYFAGISKSAAFIRESNITLLQDEAVTLAGQLFLIGRKDLTCGRTENSRLPLAALASQNMRRIPSVVMDHQPFKLEEAEAAGVCLQVSGHTHYGQLFPFNWITDAVYEKSWGYLKKGGTQFYVSCGTGTWGPPVRTAGVPEIVEITIRFTQ